MDVATEDLAQAVREMDEIADESPVDRDQWRTCKFGDLVTMISGGTPSKANSAYWNGTIPWVSGKDMKVDRLYDSEDHVTELGAMNGTRLVPAGTILIVVRGMILAKEFPVAIAMRPVTFNQDLKALQCEPDVDPQFLFYWLQAHSYEIRGIADEAAHGTKRLQTDRLQNLPVSLPPLPVQREIASILSAYDDLIENNTRRIAILEEMARRLYREWFIDFRFPGHEQVRMVESELGPIPEGWEVKRLGDLAREHRRGVSPDLLSPDTPYVGLEHIPRRSIALSEWGKAREVQSGKLAFKKGEILFGKIRPYFHKVAVAPLDGVCSTDAIVISARADELFPLVLYCVFSEDFVNHATQTSQGTKMPRANWNVLVEYPIVVPPPELLSSFNTLPADTLDLTQKLVARNRNLCRTRDLLLPKLVSGRASRFATPSTNYNH
jgi:type I restriction enzyme S subunit